MPAWSVEDGGPLSDYQVETMVLLMQKGDWEQTRDRVVNLGLAPLVPFTSEPEQAFLEQVAALPEGDVLAQGVTLYAQQCVACHGADGLGTSLAPALNDPLVSGKEASEIERVIRNGVAGTLMAGWQNALTDDEITALLTLITDWDQVPSGAIPAPDQPVPVTQESLQLGADLYAQSCARCHGAEGQGTQRAPSLNVKSYLGETSDAVLQQIVTLGVPGTAMPAWGDRLSDAEIQAVVGFMRSWEATAPEVATPARGGGPWWAVEGGTRPRKNAMPSGGVQPSAGEGSASGIGMGEQAVQPTEAVTGEEQAQTDTADLNAGAVVEQATSPGAGQAAGDQHGVEQGAGFNVDHAQGAGGQPGAGNPPWANQVETSWWQALDWRAAVLLGAVLMIAVAIIGIALFGLARVRS